MKFTTIIALILLSSVERTLNFEDFVHACMAKIAIDNAHDKVRTITDAVAKNLGDKDMFKDFTFEGLKYYEIANFPDKAKDKVKKDKASNEKKDDKKEDKKDADKNKDKENQKDTLYTKDLLEGKESNNKLSQAILDDQLKSIELEHCQGINLNDFIDYERKSFDCYYNFHFSTFFVDPKMNKINMYEATKASDIKIDIDDATLDSRYFEYWEKTPSLWGYLIKALDYFRDSKLVDINKMDKKTIFHMIYLPHVLGDLFQPIHSISIRDNKYFPSRKGDKSANDIKITKFKLTKDGKTIELNSDKKEVFDIHHLWDDLFEPNSKVSKTIPYDSTETANFNSFCNPLAEEYSKLIKDKPTTYITYEVAKIKIKEYLKESFQIAKKYAYNSINWEDNEKVFKGYKLSGGLLFSKPIEGFQREYTGTEKSIILRAHILKGMLLMSQAFNLISTKFESTKPKRKLR